MDEDMRERQGYRRGFLRGVLCAAFIVLAALLVYAAIRLGNGLSGGSASRAAEKKLDMLEALIDLYYLGEADEEDLVEGVYGGLVEGLGDPYSVYYTQEELDAMLETASGTYVGIGVTVTQDVETGQITLLNPTEGGPADLAGVKSEDILLEVDGEAVTGQDLNAVVSRIKGEEGTAVTLTVQRGASRLELEAVRATIETQTVSYEMLDGQIGYLYILEFDEVTTAQFTEALAALENEGMEKLIIDLRDNPGGNVQVVCDILDRILPEGLIVYTEDKYGEREEYWSDADNYLDCPLAVLINENSASASEILRGGEGLRGRHPGGDEKLRQGCGAEYPGPGRWDGCQADGVQILHAQREQYRRGRHRAGCGGGDPRGGIFGLCHHLRGGRPAADGDRASLRRAVVGKGSHGLAGKYYFSTTPMPARRRSRQSWGTSWRFSPGRAMR